MKAITFHGVGDVRVQDVAEPKVVDPTDVVVKITTSAVCGSDLHQYHGRGGALVQTGAVMGHEFMGTVEDLGPAVRQVRRGDRVIVPFSAQKYPVDRMSPRKIASWSVISAGTSSQRWSANGTRMSWA